MKYIVDVKGELPDSGALAKAEKFNFIAIFKSVAEGLCDNYCKWPEKTNPDSDELYEKHCDNCPLVEFF